jgi:hypothetical protein
MKIKKLVKTIWFAPYVLKNDKLKPNFKQTEKFKTGVYFIRDKKTQKILYVGYSGSNLYRTIYRHFQRWEDGQYRATFNKNNKSYQLQILFCSPQQAARLEKFFIKKYKERGEAEKNNYQYETSEETIKSNSNNTEVKDLETGKTIIEIVTARPDEEDPF